MSGKEEKNLLKWVRASGFRESICPADPSGPTAAPRPGRAREPGGRAAAETGLTSQPAPPGAPRPAACLSLRKAPRSVTDQRPSPSQGRRPGASRLLSRPGLGALAKDFVKIFLKMSCNLFPTSCKEGKRGHLDLIISLPLLTAGEKDVPFFFFFGS